MPQRIYADMTASVLHVLVGPADRIEAGDVLVVLESMKMELPVVASAAGTVAELHVHQGDVINDGDLIAVIT
jgi:acetyl-CoA carboxylase biotin carboxyl carrier protein